MNVNAIQRARYCLLFALGYCVVSFPYYTNLATFLQSDDFVIIHFYKYISLSRFWEFFSPYALFFYRPFQTIAFQSLYHTFGLVPLPYHILSFILHTVCVCLWMSVVYRLFKDVALSVLTGFFFAVSWVYTYTVSWAGNFGTLLSVLFTLVMLLSFYTFLYTRKRRWRLLSLVSLAAALLSKETAIHGIVLVSLLSVVFCVVRRKNIPEKSPDTEVPWKRSAIALIPFAILSLGYVVFHFTCVRDVYTWVKKYYAFQSLYRTPESALISLNHLFFFFRFDEVFGAASVKPIWDFLIVNVQIVPLAALIYAIIRRDPVMLFGFGFCLIALYPGLLLEDFHESRHYYLPAMGCALVMSALVLQAIRWLRERKKNYVKPLTILLVAFIGYMFLASMGYNYTLNVEMKEQSKRIERLNTFLQDKKNVIPTQSLLIVRGLNREKDFINGLGLRELVKLALEDDSIEAILEDQTFSDDILDHLRTTFSPDRHFYITYSNQRYTLERCAPISPQTSSHEGNS